MYKKIGLNIWYVKFNVPCALVENVYNIDKRLQSLNVKKGLANEPLTFWCYAKNRKRDNTDISAYKNIYWCFALVNWHINARFYYFSSWSSGLKNAGTIDNFKKWTDWLIAFFTEGREAIRKLERKFSTEIDGIANFINKTCLDVCCVFFGTNIELISHAVHLVFLVCWIITRIHLKSWGSVTIS